MSRRKWTILVSLVILLTVGAELVVRLWSTTKGCVQVINEVDGPMEDLVVRYAGTKVDLGWLGAGQSTKVWFTAAGRGILTLEFKQKDNPLKGFQVQDFDPAENSRTGSKLVLVIKSNRVERFRDEDETSINLQNLSERIREWLRP